MTKERLLTSYQGYIDCLNARAWAELGRFVHEDACHNGRKLGLAGYREMLEADVIAIPDLRFRVEFVVCDPPRLASRLCFDCTPIKDLFGIPVDGRRVQFAENVFYEFVRSKILNVWSIIDTRSIAEQIGRSAS